MSQARGDPHILSSTVQVSKPHAVLCFFNPAPSNRSKPDPVSPSYLKVHIRTMLSWLSEPKPTTGRARSGPPTVAFAGCEPRSHDAKFYCITSSRQCLLAMFCFKSSPATTSSIYRLRWTQDKLACCRYLPYVRYLLVEISYYSSQHGHRRLRCDFSWNLNYAADKQW